MMSKERLKQFKNSLDFLDDSADMSDYHRLIDTLENLYRDGELDWVHRYAREQAGRVQELEDELKALKIGWKVSSEFSQRWESKYYALAKETANYRKQRNQLERKNERYKQALEFYADDDKWYEVNTGSPYMPDYRREIEDDMGEVAHKALEGEE